MLKNSTNFLVFLLINSLQRAILISGLPQKRPASCEWLQEGAYPIGYALVQVFSLLSDPEQVYPDTQIGLWEDDGALQ